VQTSRADLLQFFQLKNAIRGSSWGDEAHDLLVHNKPP